MENEFQKVATRFIDKYFSVISLGKFYQLNLILTNKGKMHIELDIDPYWKDYIKYLNRSKLSSVTAKKVIYKEVNYDLVKMTDLMYLINSIKVGGSDGYYNDVILQLLLQNKNDVSLTLTWNEKSTSAGMILDVAATEEDSVTDPFKSPTVAGITIPITAINSRYDRNDYIQWYDLEYHQIIVRFKEYRCTNPIYALALEYLKDGVGLNDFHNDSSLIHNLKGASIIYGSEGTEVELNYYEPFIGWRDRYEENPQVYCTLTRLRAFCSPSRDKMLSDLLTVFRSEVDAQAITESITALQVADAPYKVTLRYDTDADLAKSITIHATVPRDSLKVEGLIATLADNKFLYLGTLDYLLTDNLFTVSNGGLSVTIYLI